MFPPPNPTGESPVLPNPTGESPVPRNPRNPTHTTSAATAATNPPREYVFTNKNQIPASSA